MKTYLDERKVDGLSKATVLTDDYSLTHKNNFAKPELESAGGWNVAQGWQPTTGGYDNTNGRRLRSGNVEWSQKYQWRWNAEIKCTCVFLL